ncbi:MAG: NAD(P)H-dependent oxidoreductase subunit E [Bacteroidia bacterium]|nr:MAG: NAD(P)H-dependent oxidoreductase subunit E [Bacteroidia bacterium]
MENEIDQIFNRFPNRQREDLIPIMQAIQDVKGYLSEEIIARVGDYLEISVNKIYGVATFYDNFRFGPVGRYHFRLCHGTACHVAGANTLLKELEKLLKIRDGETDKAGLFSLEVVSCVGACGLAPLIEVNEHYHTNITMESLKELVRTLRDKENNTYER